MSRLLDLFINKYNYTDFHELNLDWIISDLRTIAETLENFISLNTIKYANPIQWNITTQYEANTVVIDPNDGTAYLSVKPVPSGVAITNTDYWTPIFTLNLLSANQNITLRDDGSNVLATFASNTDDWLIWNATLYKVSRPITVNEAYVVGYNLDRYSVELFIKDYIDALNNEIGALSDLSTTDKSSIVNAINEVVDNVNTTNTNVGELSDLVTTDKSSVVNAINEVYDIATDVLEDIYYINVKEFGAVGDGVTDDTQAIQAAVDSATDKAVILFPVGVYVINGTVAINKSGIIIRGVGRNSIIKRITQTNTPIFEVNNPSSVINGFEAFELAFTDITAGTCFRISHCFDSFIHKCHINAVVCFVRYGKSTEAGMNIWSKVDNIIGDITTTSSNFIDIAYNTNGVHVTNCQINSEATYNSTFVNCRPFTAIDTVEVKDNLVQRIRFGIQIGDLNVNAVIQNFFIYNNIFDGIGQNSVIVNKENNNNIICRMQIHDNWFSNNDGIPLVFTATIGALTKVSICNNIFVKSPTRAILTQGANCRSFKIISNTFNGFNVETPASAIESCVTIGGVLNNCIISDNDFAPSSDVTANNTYGVYITPSTGIILNGNNLLNVTTPVTGTPNNAKGNYPATIDT